MVGWGVPTGSGGGLVDVGDGGCGGGDLAGGEDVFGAVGADAVGDEAVFGGVDEVGEADPEDFEVIGGEVAFEDGVLDADAVVFAVAGDFGEAAGVGDVVGDDGEHFVGGAGVAEEFAGGGGAGEGGFPPAFGGRGGGWGHGGD